MSTSRKFFVLWLIFLPFVIWKGAYEGAKVVWLLAGGFPLSLLWLLKLKDKLPGLLDKSDFWFFVWLAILLVASILGNNPADSILGGGYRHQGILFFFTLWILGKTFSFLSKDSKNFLKQGLFIGICIEAVIIIAQKVFGVTYFGRPLGTFGEPNAAAGFLAIGTSIVFEKLEDKKLIPFLALVLLAVFSTESRAGITAFLIITFGWFIFSNKYLNSQKIILSTIGVILAALVFINAAIARPEIGFESRNLLWRLGWSAVLEKPLLGYGAESIEAVYETAFEKIEIPLSGLIIDRSHNLFLDIAMWSGFIGLSLFVVWLVSEFLNLKKLGLKLAFFGWIAFAMLQPLGVVHWVLLSIIISGI